MELNSYLKQILYLSKENMEKVYLNGLTEGNMMAIGKTENNMELASMLVQMELREKENGLMEKELNGLKIIMKKTIIEKLIKIYIF